MPDEKLTEDEMAELLDSFKDSALEDKDLQAMAIGESEGGESVAPIESEEDLISAAASALEFVESLESSTLTEDVIAEGAAVSGFDALLKKLELLREDISSLQRGVVGVFAAQLLTFRGKVVELKSSISEEMVERLRMKFFKNFIESTFVDIVDTEFAALEKELVDKIVEQTQSRFKEFSARVRESEMDLRTTIVEQQNIVKSFMQSLEDDSAGQRESLREREADLDKLETEIKRLQGEVDHARAAGSASDEISRKLVEFESEIDSLRAEIVRKETSVASQAREIETARAETKEAIMKLGEAESQIEVYKAEQAAARDTPRTSDAERAAIEGQIDLIESALSDKRAEAEQLTSRVKELETQVEDSKKTTEAAEKEAAARLKELETVQDKISEIKDMEEKIYTLQKEVDESRQKLEITKMQGEAFEKATRLMEKERDMALERKDLAEERTRRYIKVLEMDASTKALILVDEVGSISFSALAKALAIPTGSVKKAVRRLEKLGVLKIEGEKAVSTLEDIEITEGEVKID